jgi:hypothetical protein
MHGIQSHRQAKSMRLIRRIASLMALLLVAAGLIPVVSLAPMIWAADPPFTFPTPLPRTVGLPSSVAIGDLNGDATLDIVLGSCIMCFSSDLVSFDPLAQVYLGKGDGSFASPTKLPGSAWTTDVALGDLNGDGALDLVSVGEPSLVYLGRGNGTFALPTELPGSSGGLPVLGELNGDGALDLVLGNWSAPSQVYLGKGNGTFESATELPGSGPSTQVVEIGDLNGDGGPDLVLGNTYASSQVYLIARKAVWELTQAQPPHCLLADPNGRPWSVSFVGLPSPLSCASR